MNVTSHDILATLEMNHFKGGIVSIERIRDLKYSIENLNSMGLFDRTFHNERIHAFPKWITSEWHNCLGGTH